MTSAKTLWKELAVFGLTSLIWLAGCSNNQPPSDQQLKQQAAKTTEQVKSGAQQAAADARTAAANAERDVNAVADGVKQGLNSNTPGNGTAIDINSADGSSLTTLPGISPARAQRIIDNRPYAHRHDLVSKGVLSQAEYDRISGQIVARQ
jgi:DNA uptake protein ComE-like DNA-binding protein